MNLRDFSDRDLHMGLDGELPSDERADFEAWLEANPDRKAINARYIADRERLREALAATLDEPVPQQLRDAVASERAPARPRWRWQALAAAVLLVVGLAAGYAVGLTGLVFGESAGDRLAENAIEAHAMYSAEKRHAVEVPASDTEHLKTWLSNRTGVPLVLPDLSAQKFALLGGRLLPTDEGPAAMLLYEDGNGERVSIFIRASAMAKVWGKYESVTDAITAIYWLDKGFGCAIVGTLAGDRMSAVARDAWRQLLAGQQT
jgi:anti-sigma factor RsiW